jgi:branched-chain amino acid transport system substrate-binding protein
MSSVNLRAPIATCALLLSAVTAASAEVRIGVATPLTGHYAWAGEQTRAGAAQVVEDLNARGGVLGEPLNVVLVDDYCDPEQAVAAANKLVAENVPFVVGHQCSGAAIPASEVYEAAEIVLISPAATNPRLTDRGLRYTFRTCGRDDLQGTMIGDLLVKRWGERRIAIVHDGQAYGQGVAEELRRRLHERGVEEALFEEIAPGTVDFTGLVDELQSAAIDVLFYGGYQHEAGVLVRQAKNRLDGLAFLLPDGVAGEDFPLIAGEASEGILMSALADARERPGASAVVKKLRDQHHEPVAATLYAYAAVQAWAQATEKAGTTDPARVAEVLRREQFDTVLGTIGFDENGDVTGFEPFEWFVWTDGKYVPKDLTD